MTPKTGVTFLVNNFTVDVMLAGNADLIGLTVLFSQCFLLQAPVLKCEANFRGIMLLLKSLDTFTGTAASFHE